MVGLDEIRALAHVTEDLLAGARAGGALPAELVEPLLRAADALRRHVEGDGEPTAPDRRARGRAAAGNGPAVRPTRRRRAAARRRTPSAARSGCPPRRSTPCSTSSARPSCTAAASSTSSAQHAGDGTRRVSDELDIGERLLDELKDAAIGMRTLPLSSIVTPLPRAVRDLAAETGKEVELVVEGAETELDRAILEGLSEPLVHLLRNAIAHGIEPPEERERAGQAGPRPPGAARRAARRHGRGHGRRRRPRRLRGDARGGAQDAARSPRS